MALGAPTREPSVAARRDAVMNQRGPGDLRPLGVGHRARSMLCLLAGVAVLVLGGCSSRSQPPPRIALSACTVAGNVAGRCGWVRVPRDWARTDGRSLSLRVAVVPATDQHPQADPLFYLAGYGGAATQDAPWALQAFERVHEARDLVFVDQRGTGSSGRETSAGLSGAAGTAPGAGALAVAVERCLASAARDPRHDTTAAAVRDLDRVRAALGYDRINLYGGSYGVTMGLAYLQRFGSHVRTAVFHSGSLLDVPLWQRVPIAAQRSFDQLAKRCARTPACAAAYDPPADLARVAARPRARPDQITVPAAGGDWPAVLRRRADLVNAAVQASSAPTQLQQITVACGDAWAAMSPREIAAGAPASQFTAPSLLKARWQRALCAGWPHDPGVSGTVSSSAPVVFLNGGADPVDPPANVAAASSTMPQAMLVTVPEAGHGVLTEGCLPDLVTDLIRSARPADHASWAACAWPSSLARFPASPE
jgi:pimeloyl-ACP methyl ester carboxylesterase